MTDTRNPIQRRQIMQAVRTKNTGPEVAVRSLIHRMGYRFRLHRKDLSGSPDIVLPRHRKVLFVNGCYWHGHECRKGKLPKSNLTYWEEKIGKNRKRDARNLSVLRAEDWRVLTVWQCELSNVDSLKKKLARFLNR